MSAGLAAVTVTPGNTPPVESVTAPATVPVSVWAVAADANHVTEIPITKHNITET